MPDALVLLSQKNEILNAIQERGLDPAGFEWIETPSEMMHDLTVSALLHKPTKYRFVFDFARDLASHYAVCYPGTESPRAGHFPGSWRGQLRHAYEWLDSLKREIEAPDLWEALSQQTRLAEAAVASQQSNRPFTPEEIARISAGLHEIQTYLITTQGLAGEQAEFVRRRLDYLADAATRQPRQDWLHLSIGVLVTIIVSVGLTPDFARDLFSFFANIFHDLLDGILSLPHEFFTPRLR